MMRIFSELLSRVTLASFLAAVSLALPAQAATVTLTDPGATYAASDVGPCFPDAWSVCGARGYLNYGSNINQNTVFASIENFHTPPGETQPTGTETFQTGFDSFGNGWTLANGGSLSNLSLNISRFRTTATLFSAGVELQVDVEPGAGYSGPSLANLFWIQSLLINYRPVDPGNAIHNVLDEANFNALSGCTPLTGSLVTGGDDMYCGPIYPFQYNEKFFYDYPGGIYPIDSMRGIALLATVNADSKTVTVYDGGVSYGFDVWVPMAVPEPSGYLLVGGGLAVLAGLRRRSQSVSALRR